MALSFLAPSVARIAAVALAPGGLALVGTSPTSDLVPIGGRGLRSATGVSGGLGVKLAGSCVITAARGTDPNLFDTPSVSQTVTAYRGPHGTLTFSTKAKKPTVGKTYRARTTGSAAGLRVTFKALTSACKVNASGRVTFRKAGTCVLTASQTGTADYYPSNTAIQTITVKKEPKKRR